MKGMLSLLVESVALWKVCEKFAGGQGKFYIGLKSIFFSIYVMIVTLFNQNSVVARLGKSMLWLYKKFITE